MYYLIATIDVTDFVLLQQFESAAASIMADYDGEILHALETERRSDGFGKEVHLLAFPDQSSFSRYREDPRLKQLVELRERAISATHVQEVLNRKSYAPQQ